MSEGNGSKRLWTFLLELLTTDEHKNKIRWVGTDGHFKIIKPKLVAKMWGSEKGIAKMSYEKLARSLRNYYGKNLIEKSTHKYAYHFNAKAVEDLIGYRIAEIAG